MDRADPIAGVLFAALLALGVLAAFALMRVLNRLRSGGPTP